MDDSVDTGVVVTRRRTTAERVHKIDPVELYRSRNRIVTFSGTDIARTAGAQLAGKLVQRDPRDHSKVDVAISLPADALAKLAQTLNSIDSLRESSTVMIVPASANSRNGKLKAAIDVLLGQSDALASIDPDTLASLDLGLHQMRRLSTMKNALTELDALLDGDDHDEKHYQAWCARNGWAFGVEYERPDTVRSIAAEDNVDLLMPRLTGYRDVIELKRPDAKTILEDRARGTWYWSNDAAKAISQGLRYTEKLSEAAKHGLDDHREIVAYHPLATIVIGRSAGWSDVQRRWMVRLNAALHGVQVMTYDDLRARAARMLAIVSTPESGS